MQMVLRCTDISIAWNELLHDESPSFIGMVKVCKVKTAASLKVTASVAEPV